MATTPGATASSTRPRFDFAAAEAAYERGERWVHIPDKAIRVGGGSLFETAKDAQELLELDSVPETVETLAENYQGEELYPVQYILLPVDPYIDLCAVTESLDRLEFARAANGKKLLLHTPTVVIPEKLEERRAWRRQKSSVLTLDSNHNIVDEDGNILGNIFGRSTK
ncbi:hypothetical protein SEUCBS139899_005897 [Sporothrix eucalyptigena]|uniref:Uncharacterized protein n=1 Tax=Sporothrix eucalyptigena TaxID=1812306 RepID=A0ABP0AX58_9PEZI